MRSMTGCGRSQQREGAWEVTVELKAVNHRFLDIACRLPRSLSFLEETVRKALSARLRRGHVDVFVTVARTDASDRQVQVDEALAAAYRDAAERLAEVLGRFQRLDLAQLMTMEGVVTVTESDMDEEAVSAACRRAMDEAIHQLCAMREREGESLRADLTVHLDASAALREKILLRAPGVVEDYRARLQQRLAQLGAEDVEPQRVAQEVAIMADRCAIDEELSRLESHIGQLRAYLDAQGETGKKMDFLIQEMNREANTIGSKGNDLEQARNVVAIKAELEKIREQVQNIE